MAPATHTDVHTSLGVEDAGRCGMGIAVTAREHPERLAVASPRGDRSFDFLNARVNQLSRALRARGLEAGDSVALVCSNRPEFAVATYACLRSGFRLTPINWHLTAPEIGYILDNCEARAVLGDAAFRAPIEGAIRSLARKPVGLAIGDPIHGFDLFDDALDAESPHDLEDPALGSAMLYTSGTTGRPKGVYRPPEASMHIPGAAEILARVGYVGGRDLHLATGPFYHSAPLAFSLAGPLNAGCGVVMMDTWDAERALELIQGYRVTHTHMVPVMFRRLLALPAEVRERCDLSSLRVILHGAAPCPVHTKQAILDWLGPILWEYYAATEGWGCLVGPEEWLARPGTVGKPAEGQVQIRADDGTAVGPGESGAIYLRRPEGGGFEYYRDADKTQEVFDGDHYTLGDVGYFDDDGYLFLNDRSADVIISGGMNIYPAEIDAVLAHHPSVKDVATVGAPDPEWGEKAVSVVELEDGALPGSAMAEALLEHCQSQLAQYKCPREIDFTWDLPRTEAGKIQRRLVRERYWKDHDRRI